jgi:hypothetical protein
MSMRNTYFDAAIARCSVGSQPYSRPRPKRARAARNTSIWYASTASSSGSTTSL